MLMNMRTRLVLLAFLMCFSGFASSANSVTVKGLFSGAALLIIDGQQVLLKKAKKNLALS